MKHITIINSNIKGYHIFKVKPHLKIEMLVERELDNKYDSQATIVKIPELNKINAGLHGEVTKEAKGKQPQQKVKDIAGKTVGRVPANV